MNAQRRVANLRESRGMHQEEAKKKLTFFFLYVDFARIEHATSCIHDQAHCLLPETMLSKHSTTELEAQLFCL